jgi:ketosteroid isomerase-like protein
MTTRLVVQAYLDALSRKNGWQEYFADDVMFTTFTIPNRRSDGKRAFLESTSRFYASIASMKVLDLLVDGDKACARTHYDLRTPNGTMIESDVAELFTVINGKIRDFAIYFDSAPFPK